MNLFILINQDNLLTYHEILFIIIIKVCDYTFLIFMTIWYIVIYSRLIYFE